MAGLWDLAAAPPAPRGGPHKSEVSRSADPPTQRLVLPWHPVWAASGVEARLRGLLSHPWLRGAGLDAFAPAPRPPPLVRLSWARDGPGLVQRLRRWSRFSDCPSFGGKRARHACFFVAPRRCARSDSCVPKPYLASRWRDLNPKAPSQLGALADAPPSARPRRKATPQLHRADRLCARQSAPLAPLCPAGASGSVADVHPKPRSV